MLVGRVLIEPRVLGVDMFHDRRIVQIAQPLVIVNEGLAVEGTFDGHVLGARRAGIERSHGPIVGVNLTNPNIRRGP